MGKQYNFPPSLMLMFQVLYSFLSVLVFNLFLFPSCGRAFISFFHKKFSFPHSNMLIWPVHLASGLNLGKEALNY